MTRRVPLLLTLAAFAACGGDSPTTPALDSEVPALKKVGQVPPGLSAADQELYNAFNEGRTTGAFVNHDFCGLFSLGFRDENGGLLGFSLFIPDECPQGFERQNPNGTFDQHISGGGQMFLVLIAQGAFFGSEGSDVRWTIKRSETGTNVFNINGTLSDGSRVKGHFNSGNNGNSQSGKLWVEGLGYVVGSPGGK